MVSQNAIFAGENQSSIDAKGRTSVPAKYREALSCAFGDERFVVTKARPIQVGDNSFARGLSVYPVTVWAEIREKILANAGGFTSPELDGVKRQFLNPAEECCADKLGRVLLPASLRQHAGLERDIWFVGMGNRFDIWSRETYERVNSQDEKNLPVDLTALGL